jgi:hypothetical protein
VQIGRKDMVKKKVKQSRYTPWRRLGEEEVMVIMFLKCLYFFNRRNRTIRDCEVVNALKSERMNERE